MKTHGDPGWEEFPSYLDIFIPQILDILDGLNLKITFFIVGKDAALNKNRDVIELLTERGHEVGNHSFHHEPWLHRYSKDKVKREVLEAEEHIFKVTGQKPIGFRGPGFSWSPDLLDVLAENGYLYDASIFPTYIGPLARVYYFSKANLREADKEKRKELFGSFKDGLKPVKPHLLHLSSGATILEIPVTTIPIIKIPFHLSYLLYLSCLSTSLMSLYLKFAITLCRITGTEPSFLLHPLDFIGGDQVRELAFFPGMDLQGTKKMGLCKKVLKELAQHFNLMNMSSHARSVLNQVAITTLEVI